MVRVLKGRTIVAGEAAGKALVTAEPISFWGGWCPRTGEIIDRRHELSGTMAAGRVFVFPRGRGSSTASAILLESIKNGVAPAAIVNLDVEPILALGSIVSDELYQRPIPIVVLDEPDFFSIEQDDDIHIDPDGIVTVQPSHSGPVNP